MVKGIVKIPPLRNFSEDLIIYDFMEKDINERVKETVYLQQVWFEFILSVLANPISDIFQDVISRKFLKIGRFVLQHFGSFTAISLT